MAINWGDVGGGALTGAGIGSSFGPWGAAAGGLIGGGLGALSGSKNDPLKTKSQEQRFERFTPEQQNILSQLSAILTGQGQQPTGGLLGNVLGDQGFEAYKQPAMRSFFEEIAPRLTEQFTAAGAKGSSAFQSALARSGENLARSLGELRGQQQQNLLSALLGPLLTPQFHTQYTPGSLTGLGSLFSGVGGGFGQTIGTGLGNKFLDRLNLSGQSNQQMGVS